MDNFIQTVSYVMAIADTFSDWWVEKGKDYAWQAASVVFMMVVTLLALMIIGIAAAVKYTKDNFPKWRLVVTVYVRENLPKWQGVVTGFWLYLLDIYPQYANFTVRVKTLTVAAYTHKGELVKSLDRLLSFAFQV